MALGERSVASAARLAKWAELLSRRIFCLGICISTMGIMVKAANGRRDNYHHIRRYNINMEDGGNE